MLRGKWKLQILYELFSSIFAIIASLQYIFSYWNVLAANVSSRFENRRFSKPSMLDGLNWLRKAYQGGGVDPEWQGDVDGFVNETFGAYREHAHCCQTGQFTADVALLLGDEAAQYNLRAYVTPSMFEGALDFEGETWHIRQDGYLWQGDEY